MTRTEEFQELRPLLFAIAYRILGSVGEAEAVPGTWLPTSLQTTHPPRPRLPLSRGGPISIACCARQCPTETYVGLAP